MIPGYSPSKPLDTQNPLLYIQTSGIELLSASSLAIATAGVLLPEPQLGGSMMAMKRLQVLFFFWVLLFPACSTAPRSNAQPIYPQNNPELYARIQRIGELLLPVMDKENRAKYRLAILDTSEVNAFADGSNFQIVFYRGLLDQFTDQEAAYVYAHEIAHIKLGHYGKRIAASIATSVAFTVAGLFVPGLSYLDWVANPVVTRGFSRSQEMDADALAVKSIGQCCSIPPDAAVSALGKLQGVRKLKGYKEEDRIGILDTHPSLEERIRRIREGA
jgi:Zn-dependent protease with chaperone function